jgi:hypothetical protein
MSLLALMCLCLIALDCVLNAIIRSELPFLDTEAIVAELVSMTVLIQVSLKLSASFREISTKIQR